VKKVISIDLNDATVYLTELQQFSQEKSLVFLTETEKTKLLTILHPKKKNEFITSRWLRTELFGLKEISYSTHGSPAVEGISLHVSFSHGGNYVGIATSNLPVGFDIEPIAEKAKSVKQRFVNIQIEKDWNNESNKDMTALWSLKESMYKLSDRNLLLFQEHLLCLNKKDLIGKVLTSGGEKLAQLAYICHNNHILSIAKWQ
jgi:4'-phosphopantetheinyl transferase